MTPTPFTAALLAGGNSLRKAPEKASFEWEGQALWKRQLALLESLNPAQLLIFGRPDGPYATTKHEIIVDQESVLGPLAGLNALLLACTTPRLLVLAVDMPWMTRSVLEQLLSFEDGIIPEHQGSRESNTAVYPADILPLVRNTLQSPDRSMQSLIRLALNNGFIDTWTIPEELEKCFQTYNP